MNHSRALFWIPILLLLFAVSSATACDQVCYSTTFEVTLQDCTPANAILALESGLKWASEAGCTVITAASERINELPEIISSTFGEAGQWTTEASKQSAGLLESVGHAITNFASSLLRIIFSSISARA